MQALDKILAGDGASRPSLAVLTGPGGAGKTAVALQWLHNNVHRFPDGLLYADLGAFGSGGPAAPSTILDGFLRALGVPPGDVPIDLAGQTAQYRSMSAGKAPAVFADDAQSAAQVRPLLPASPSSALVVTSRWRLAGLVMDGSQNIAVDVLDESSALTLFSLVVGPDKVDNEPTSTRELVRLCGGLPIALCIAAARLATRPRWSISRIVDTLADEQRRLSSLAVAGEISVQANFDLSYHELVPGAARLYRLLGLHPGTEFGLGVAAAAGDMSPGVTEDLVADLVDVNLLTEVADDRFRFHDLLRLHAEQRAKQQDTYTVRAAAVRRIVEWYLDSAIAADLVVMPLRQRLGPRYAQAREHPPAFSSAVTALDWLERELPNMLAAQQRAVDREWWDVTWQLCEALWSLFLYRKHFPQWIRAHELGVNAAERCGNQIAQSRLTVQHGIADLTLQRYDTAYQHFAKALELSRLARDADTEATALEHLGLAARSTGRREVAIDHFERALAITEHLGQHRGSALHLRRLGETLCETGRDHDAVPYLQRAVAVATELGDTVFRARALPRLGTVQTRLNQIPAALECLREAVGVLASSGSQHYHAEAVEALADLHLHTGDLPTAREHFQQAIDLYDGSQLPRARQVQARLEALAKADAKDGPDATIKE